MVGVTQGHGCRFGDLWFNCMSVGVCMCVSARAKINIMLVSQLVQSVRHIFFPQLCWLAMRQPAVCQELAAN